LFVVVSSSTLVLTFISNSQFIFYFTGSPIDGWREVET
jgi:hypothetical protein